MVSNKLQLTRSQLYSPAAMRSNLVALKTLDKRLVDYNTSKQSIVEVITYSKVKFIHNAIVSEVVV